MGFRRPQKDLQASRGHIVKREARGVDGGMIARRVLLSCPHSDAEFVNRLEADLAANSVNAGRDIKAILRVETDLQGPF
jgi:hypothetical protein